MSPPDLYGGGDPAKAADTTAITRPAATTTQQATGCAHCRPRRRPAVGRYAHVWREGFGRGFRDALRLAARRLPPHTWPTLAELADQYELAGGDE
jgi:hypothetical protein